jgi:adenylate cyclase
VEIDLFSGENAGLIIAEIELRHERQGVRIARLIGAEVTGQPQFYNSALVRIRLRAVAPRHAGQGGLA